MTHQTPCSNPPVARRTECSLHLIQIGQQDDKFINAGLDGNLKHVGGIGTRQTRGEQDTRGLHSGSISRVKAKCGVESKRQREDTRRMRVWRLLRYLSKNRKQCEKRQ